MKRSLRVIIIAGATFSATAIPAWAGGGGCHRDATDAPTSTVEIQANCFSPNIIRTVPGETITFHNRDLYGHNLVGHHWGVFDEISASGFEIKFDTEGIYPFACTVHAGMVGAIVVAANPADSSRSDVPVDGSEQKPDLKSSIVVPGLGVIGLTVLAAWWRRRD